MKKRLIVVMLVLLALSTGLVAAQETPAPGEAFTTEPRRCPVELNPVQETEGQTYRCGVVFVPENYDEPDGRVIELTFIVLKSTSLTPEPDPVVYLSGGPGGSALQEISSDDFGLRPAFSKIRERRDIITFDQRGDRYSSMLYCATFIQFFKGAFEAPPELAEDETFTSFMQMVTDLDGASQAAVVQGGCGRLLTEVGIDVSQYRSYNSVRDIQNVVELAGYPGQYNLYGISYGTRLSLTTMRDMPENIRSVVLDSTYPPEVMNYEHFPRVREEAYQQVFALCAADEVCNAEYPNLEQRFIDLMTRLGEEPIVVDPPIPTAGTMVGNYLIPGDTLTQVTPSLFAQIADISNLMTDGGFWVYVPAVIHYLEQGDVETVVGLLNGQFLPPVQPPMPSPELERLVQAQEAEAATLAEVTAAAEAALAVARANRLSTQWLQAVTDDLAVAEENEAQAALAFFWLAMEPTTDDSLTRYANAALTPEAATTANAIAAQMTREDVRETIELVQEVGIQAVGYDTGSTQGQNFAIECYDEVPFQSVERETEILASMRYPNLYPADQRVVQQRIDICAIFEGGPVETPEIETQRVESDIPTLVLQGLIDTQTAASWGASAAEGLSNGFLVNIAPSGHGTITKVACVQSFTAHFLDHPDVLPNTGCIATTFPFLTVTSIEELKTQMAASSEATPEATEAP